MDELQILKDAYDALVECQVNEDAFDFGPAYERAAERRLQAMARLKQLIREKEKQ